MSGVQQTFFSLNGGTTRAGTSVTVNTYGENTIHYYSIDAAGNQETSHTAVVRFDPQAPAINLTVPLSVYWTDPIVMNIGITDALSGVASSNVTLDGAVVGSNINLPPLSLWLGQHTIVVTATDIAGNTIVRTFVLKVVMDLDHLDDLLRLLWNLGYFQNQNVYNSLQNTVAVLQRLLGQSQLKDPTFFDTAIKDGKYVDSATTKMLQDALLFLQQKYENESSIRAYCPKFLLDDLPLFPLRDFIFRGNYNPLFRKKELFPPEGELRSFILAISLEKRNLEPK